MVFVLGTKNFMVVTKAYIYIPNIEIGIKLLHIWYYTKSLPNYYYYKVGIILCHISPMGSLILMLIPNKGPCTRSSLVFTLE
jgi:hypothetical protein